MKLWNMLLLLLALLAIGGCGEREAADDRSRATASTTQPTIQSTTQSSLPATLPAKLAPNRPELALPIAGEKLVIAHYMTGMIPSPQGETGWLDLSREDPAGPTAAVGGLYQTRPMVSEVYPGLLPLEQAALFEMRAAKLLGIDGFNFYYPLGPDEAFRDRYDRYVLAFFDAAEANDLDFKLTLCLSPLGGELSVDEKANVFGEHLKTIWEKTSESDNWLKTPDGRLLVYTWLPDAFVARELTGRHWEIRDRPELVGEIARACNSIASVAGVEAAFLYHLDQIDQPGLTDAVLDHFPAVYAWVSVGDDLPRLREIASHARERNRTYVQEVHPDYYTSKVYPIGGHDLIGDVDEVLRLGTGNIERHAQILGVTQTFREKLDLALELDSPLINVTTWNDFPEGHHLAPEATHHFGFSLLLKDYVRRWRGGEATPEDDTVAVFFKKYRSDVTPDPFNIRVVQKKAIAPASEDDFLEVVTMLKAPGRLSICGDAPIDAPAGLHVSRVPLVAGLVAAVVKRDGEIVAAVTADQEVLSAPRRTDRLTYSKSNRYDEIRGKIFSPATTQPAVE